MPTETQFIDFLPPLSPIAVIQCEIEPESHVAIYINMFFMFFLHVPKIKALSIQLTCI